MTSDKGRLKNTPYVRQNYGYMYEGNCICDKYYLVLHVVHAFGVHMSWCMGCMWDISHIVAPPWK